MNNICLDVYLSNKDLKILLLFYQAVVFGVARFFLIEFMRKKIRILKGKKSKSKNASLFSPWIPMGFLKLKLTYKYTNIYT